MKKIIIFLLIAVLFCLCGYNIWNKSSSHEKLESVTDNIVEERAAYLNDICSMDEISYLSLDDVEKEADVIIIGKKKDELAQYIIDHNWFMNDNGKEILIQRGALDGYTISEVEVNKVIKDENHCVNAGDIIVIKEGSCYDDRRNCIILETIYKKMNIGSKYVLMLNKIEKTDYLTSYEYDADYSIVGGIFGKISLEGKLESEDIVKLFDDQKKVYMDIMMEGIEKYAETNEAK